MSAGMFMGTKIAPRIVHQNRKPGDGDDLINRVCDAMHVNAAARRLLLFYSHCPQTYMVHQLETSEKAKIKINNISRSRQELEALGLITKTERTIIMDWDRFRKFALLDESKTAKVLPKKNSQSSRAGGFQTYISSPSEPDLKTLLKLNESSSQLPPFDAHVLAMTKPELQLLINVYKDITAKPDPASPEEASEP